MNKITKKIKGYEFPWFTNQELLKIFPEAKNIISEKIHEYQNKSEKIKDEIREILNRVEKVSKKDMWFYELYVAKFYLPILREQERHILRLKISLNTPQSTERKFFNFSEKIEIARNYPVYELARSKLELRPSGKNFIALCPFHDEKTPSFYLYTETNTYVCFGCNEKGQVINLCMYLYGLNFKEAVLMLQK